MRENEPTERYEFRTSNLMHDYYAVNSVDGMFKKIIINNNTPNYYKNILAECKLIYNAMFNFAWNGIFTQFKFNLLPNVIAVPAYLTINNEYLTVPVINNINYLKHNRYINNTKNK